MTGRKAAKADARAQDLAPMIAELRALAKGLNARGYSTARDKRWSAAQVKRVLEKAGAARSLREIADELAQLGFSTATGKPFSAAQVHRLLGRD